MMKEILRNGIVNGELQAPSIFHMYKTGVLTENGIQQLSDKVNGLAQTEKVTKAVNITDKNLADRGISW